LKLVAVITKMEKPMNKKTKIITFGTVGALAVSGIAFGAKVAGSTTS